MSTVPMWSGQTVRALREARRMSVREFAAHLGVSDRMVSKWEAAGDGMRPRAVNQAALDASLAMASVEMRTRFGKLAGGRVSPVEVAGTGPAIRHLVRHPVDGKLMTLVEAGAYTPDGGSAVWAPAYYIDVYPTTGGDYAQFVAATGHRPPAQWPGGKCTPVLAEAPVQVPWVDAQAYATWAGKSLPTAFEWDRFVESREAAIVANLAEWCAGPRGPRRHEPRAGATAAGQPTFRGVLSLPEMLALLAI